MVTRVLTVKRPGLAYRQGGQARWPVGVQNIQLLPPVLPARAAEAGCRTTVPYIIDADAVLAQCRVPADGVGVAFEDVEVNPVDHTGGGVARNCRLR